jgi:cytochrome c-type biogenesis protein CcmF
MIIELGHFALALAFAVAAIAAVLGFAFWRRQGQVTPYLRAAAVVQFVLVALAFGTLIYAFVTADFSLALAYQHDHSQMPLIFKVTSVWGSHEGSMVLWISILVLFGALVAIFGRRLPEDLLALVLAMQALLVAAFTAFTLFTSNPFLRLNPAPPEGQSLNPILQDIGLALHPPLLYTGYVGFSICFSFAIAALISGRIDAAWARWVRPWALLSWCFLTLGIAMGSYWAYYELGWGGWWSWDPVENASFMPWLAGAALLHSALVMERRNALKVWTIFLSIIAFSLSLLGTFLVRSGVLNSVHSFAEDPTRGIVILALLAVIIGGAFTLFAMRASALRVGGLFAPISREGALILNNLFLATGLAAVFVGTLYPLILQALTGRVISVGPPFFDLTFGLLMAPLLVLLPFGPFLAWKRGDLIAATQRLAGAIILALIAGLVVYVLAGHRLSLAPLGLLFGIWVGLGAIADLVDRSHLGRVAPAESWRRLVGLPRSAWSTAIAHFGLGVCVIGVVAATAWSSELVTTMAPGDTKSLVGYTLHFDSIDKAPGPNYSAERGLFTVTDPYGQTRVIEPEKRVYTAQQQPTTQAAITNYWLSQLYVQLGEKGQGNSYVVRIWFKPFVLCIWFGAMIMAFAGFLSLTDRRLRVGVPRRRVAVAPEPVPEAAE